MWFKPKPARAADITAEQLHAEFVTCRAEVRAMQLEWERTYAKLRGIVARMSRKEGEIEDAPPAAPEHNTLPMSQQQLRGVSHRSIRRNY